MILTLLTTIDWSELSVEKFLTQELPAHSKVVKEVAPVLHRLLLHHGVWPFKPDANSRLTLENLVVAVTLLTSEDQHYINFEVQVSPHSHFSGPRSWSDRCRLLFQSMCDTDWVKTSCASPKDITEDEDLIAAMYVSMDDAYGSKWGRSRFNAVAATLPSSHSRKLNGHVAIEDFRALLELLIVANVDCTMAEADVTRVLDVLTSWPNGETLDYETFKWVIEARLVCRPSVPLAPLTGCISSLSSYLNSGHLSRLAFLARDLIQVTTVSSM